MADKMANNLRNITKFLVTVHPIVYPTLYLFESQYTYSKMQKSEFLKLLMPQPWDNLNIFWSLESKGGAEGG